MLEPANRLWRHGKWGVSLNGWGEAEADMLSRDRLAVLLMCPRPLFLAHVAGSDLYLIPGIDMINHSTQPSRSSAALKLVNQPLTVMCGEPLKEVTLEGYFAMIAGE